MANINVLDAAAASKYLKTSGTGAIGDPFIPEHLETNSAAILAKLPAVGQALAAASVPVVLTAAQLTTLTPVAAITGFATAAKQPALGTAGSASTDVITVQGIASGTAQPVSIALPATIYNGVKNVTTAGTRVTLAASQAITSGVTIKAKAANTGTIYVGDGSVASTTGFALAAGDTVFLEVANLATVNLDSSVNGEGVTYIAT